MSGDMTDDELRARLQARVGKIHLRQRLGQDTAFAHLPDGDGRKQLEEEQEQQRKELAEACMTLVRKVCGPRSECEDHPACDPARQLLLMEDDELHLGARPGSTPESSRQCLEALQNETFFAACDQRGTGMPLSSCEQLQRRVCGKDRGCAASDACNAAGQLVKMEREDRYASPGGSTQAGEQCRGLLNDQGFFHSCDH